MKILSHRGYWKTGEEKNTAVAFARSFNLGFGTETDVRDCAQRLLISHDMPTNTEMSVAEFLSSAATAQPTLTLALNIKADGLAVPLRQALDVHPNLDCFVFDMSVPDMLGYFNAGIPVFSRMSEVERDPAWLERARGVWLDAFATQWFGASEITELLGRGKRVCIVSPELHKREHLPFWESIRHLNQEPALMMCTDFPESAQQFFHSD
jgi:hypothetical protein